MKNAVCFGCNHLNTMSLKCGELHCPAYCNNVPEEIKNGTDKHEKHRGDEDGYVADLVFEEYKPQEMPPAPNVSCSFRIQFEDSDEEIIHHICEDCVHFDGTRCPAFDEIPYHIIDEIGHDIVFPGQNMAQIRFERKKYSIKKGEVCTGKENFIGGNEFPFRNLTIMDFRAFQYSNIWNMIADLAEFIVAKALGKEKPINREFWSLWDINYQGYRIEVKATSDYHSWDKEEKKKPTRRTFSIAQTHEFYKVTDADLVRNNDIYVFCYNKGNTPEESYPLNLGNWEFYIIPTNTIDKLCGKQKTISLTKVQKIAGKAVSFDHIKDSIDNLIKDII